MSKAKNQSGLDRNKYSWLMLSEISGRPPRSLKEPTLVPKGRPRNPFPKTQTSVRLTSLDLEAINRLRSVLKNSLGREVPLGEVFGFACNVLLDRMGALNIPMSSPGSLIEMVDQLVGKDQ